MRDTRHPPVMAALPSGRKTLPSGWWLREFEPGTTLLARDLKREFRQRRGLSGQDERLQREARSYAQWAWHVGDFSCLREFGTA